MRGRQRPDQSPGGIHCHLLLPTNKFSFRALRQSTASRLAPSAAQPDKYASRLTCFPRYPFKSALHLLGVAAFPSKTEKIVLRDFLQHPRFRRFIPQERTSELLRST